MPRQCRVKKAGRCAPSGQGFCAALDEDLCQASEHCGERGLCHVYDPPLLGSKTVMRACRANTDADCSASTECTKRGDCGMRDRMMGKGSGRGCNYSPASYKGKTIPGGSCY